ncbi:hypothetical protein U1Q18_030495, partial [Sarracenia purpurea var. burkii]
VSSEISSAPFATSRLHNSLHPLPQQPRKAKATSSNPLAIRVCRRLSAVALNATTTPTPTGRLRLRLRRLSALW